MRISDIWKRPSKLERFCRDMQEVRWDPIGQKRISAKYTPNLDKDLAPGPQIAYQNAMYRIKDKSPKTYRVIRALKIDQLF